MVVTKKELKEINVREIFATTNVLNIEIKDGRHIIFKLSDGRIVVGEKNSLYTTKRIPKYIKEAIEKEYVPEVKEEVVVETVEENIVEEVVNEETVEEITEEEKEVINRKVFIYASLYGFNKADVEIKYNCIGVNAKGSGNSEKLLSKLYDLGFEEVLLLVNDKEVF